MDTGRVHAPAACKPVAACWQQPARAAAPYPALSVRDLLPHVLEVLLHDGDAAAMLLNGNVHCLQLALQLLCAWQVKQVRQSAWPEGGGPKREKPPPNQAARRTLAVAQSAP